MSSDGWTNVTSKKGNRKPRAQNSAPSSMTQYDRDATVESLTQHINSLKQKWIKTDVYRHQIRGLQNLYLKDGPPITKAVCLGIGVFSTINLEIRNRSMVQLLVFLTFVEHLKALHENDIDLVVQEPRLAEVDREFLATFNMRILDYKPLKWNEQNLDIKGIGPVTDLFGSDAFVADFYLDHTPLTIKQLFDSQCRLIISAANRMPERTEFPERWKDAQNLLRTLSDRYRWFDLVLRTHDALYENALFDQQAFASILED